MERISWTDYFIAISTLVAKRSTCLRRQVGAVLVKDNRVLATGYNGVPSGLEHCDKVGCIREKLSIPSGQRLELCRAVHAEQNCISQAAKYGISTEGSTIYCTCTPCVICAGVIINSGITEVVICGNYPNNNGIDLLSSANIKITTISIN